MCRCHEARQCSHQPTRSNALCGVVLHSDPSVGLRLESRWHDRLCLHVQDFVSGLADIPEAARAALAQLTPATYIGNAAEQVAGLFHSAHCYRICSMFVDV